MHQPLCPLILGVSAIWGANEIKPSTGKEEIASHIGRSLNGEAYGGAGAGARIPISSGVDQHHGLFRFSWVMVDPQDQLLLEGMDFVEPAGDGRLQRITGFFGAFLPIPESWPEHLVWRSE